MPDHEDSLGGETFSGEEQQDPAEQSLGDGATMGGDTAAHSLGDQSTFGDANVDDELFDDGMEVVDLSTRYTEEGVLGKGGFGEVVLATDTRLGRKVAIKRIQGKAARRKTAVQRFLTEAKSIAALSHNNIVQIHDYGRSTDGPFLIMECVQGGSLLDLCRKRQPEFRPQSFIGRCSKSTRGRKSARSYYTGNCPKGLKRVAKHLAKEKEAMNKIVTTSQSVVAVEALDMKFHETLLK